MPYERKGKCVYKPTGKKVGCSDTEAKAKKYIKALYASELNESLPNTITPEEQAKIKEIMQAFLADKQTWIDKYGLEQANFVMYKTAVKKAKNLKPEKEETMNENFEKKLNRLILESLEKKGVINEGIFSRAKAKIKGATAGFRQGIKNLKANWAGDLDAITHTKFSSGMAKLSVKLKDLDKALTDTQNDIEKLFPEEQLENQPQLGKIIDQYKNLLKQVKQQNSALMNPSGNDSSQSSPEGKEINQTIKYQNKTYNVKEEGDGKRYIDVDGKKVYLKRNAQTTTTTNTSKNQKKNPQTKNPQTQSKQEYKSTGKKYTYKGKKYDEITDTKTGGRYFKADDGRVMDINNIEKNKKTKSPNSTRARDSKGRFVSTKK